MGGLPQFHRANVMISSTTFMNDELTFCVARSKVYPSYLSIMHILTPELWIFIFAFGFINGIILFVAQKFSRNEKKMTYNSIIILFAFRVFVNSPSNLRPKSTWFRIFFFSDLLFGFFFLCTFFHFSSLELAIHIGIVK